MIETTKYVPETGQSGAGKGTFNKRLKYRCESLGISIQIMSIGERIAELAKLPENAWPKTLIPYYKELKEVAPTGAKQRYEIVEEILKEMLAAAKASGVQIFVVDGTLRDKKEVEFWEEFAKAEYVHAAMVYANENDCIERLVKRTRQDKRFDLSVDGQPGEPDMEKIKLKMSWFRPKERTQEILEANLRLFSVENDVEEQYVEALMDEYVFELLEQLGFPIVDRKTTKV